MWKAKTYIVVVVEKKVFLRGDTSPGPVLEELMFVLMISLYYLSRDQCWLQSYIFPAVGENEQVFLWF